MFADGSDDIRIAHVPAWVIILVDRKNPRVVLVLVVQGTEILRVFGDENEPVPLSIAKMNIVGFPSGSGVCWPDHGVPRLGEQLGQEVGVRTIIEVQIQGHGLCPPPGKEGTSR